VQARSPAVPTAALTAQQRWLDNVADARWTAGLMLPTWRLGAAARQGSRFGDLNEALLAEAHALGLRVVPWTVNDSAQADRLMQWPVDGVISDYPDRVRQAMAQRGMALPAPLKLP
jgi:glycerophosphoryl diester phosphodiesterase